MFALTLIQSGAVSSAVIALQSWQSALGRVWYYLNHPITIGNIEVSATKLIEGALILALTVIFSRTLSRLLQRSISKKARRPILASRRRFG